MDKSSEQMSYNAAHVRFGDYLKHETKKSALIKYVLLMTIVIIYFYIVALKYGTEKGFFVTLLTWSFFVFCTPIADAGFLIGFPARVLLNIRMLYSEIAVTIFAILIDIIAFLYAPYLFNMTGLLKLYRHILLNPIPYWLIIIISTIGTFVSVFFGDELIDVAKHENRKLYHKHRAKYYTLVLLFLLVFIGLLYMYLLEHLNVSISIF